MSAFTVLLYYKYVSLPDPEATKVWQKELCRSLNLKGRILIADEGINGTLAGHPEDVEAYVRETSQQPAFADIEWKYSWAEEQVFPRLRVVVRDEIVTLGIKKSGVDVSIDNKAHYIEPEELLALYEKNEDFLILDARNDYEAEIGKFKNAVVPPIDAFREFPEFVKTIADYKDKPVVTYCTGGVRCEKASAFMREQGFSDVRQLHGGVHVYAEKTGGKYFEGELFVFDKRLHMQVNTVNPTPIAECQFCGTKVSRYIDCVEFSCPELFICCEACDQRHHSLCPGHANKDKQQTATNQKTMSVPV